MRLLIVILFWCFAMPAFAVNPDEILADPALEARARKISKGLRCVVCRNQNIDGSNAAIARDMRILLGERLQAGDSDEEAIAYFVARYGIFVLLRPPVQANTYLLWLGPFLIFAAAAGGFVIYLRGRNPLVPDSDPLSDEDRLLVATLLDDAP